MEKLFYLLARSVEDVEEASLAVDHHLLPIAVLDRGIVLVDEVILDQLDCQSRLAHATSCKTDMVRQHLQDNQGATAGTYRRPPQACTRSW